MLDADGTPVGVRSYVTKEANHLVEEFMLLANCRVAHAVADAFPECAVLRMHPPPDQRKLEQVRGVSAEQARL